MATKPTRPSTNTSKSSKRKAIAASSVGLSLTISDKTLREFDRIQEKTIKAVKEDQKFSWR